MPFILASESPRRLQLLASLGIVPDSVEPADIDETQLEGELPKKLPVRLAYEKMRAVVARGHEGDVVLAADTVVAIGRRVLPKAMTDDDVRACFRLMSGRRHHVYTAVAVQDAHGKIFRSLSDNIVQVKKLNDKEIERFVASGEGIGKAGGYGIQALMAAYISSIRGSHSGIMGLPLYETAQILAKCGVF